jgi:hypothetical protein
MIDASTYGAPNWVDLSTPDIKTATQFYRDLLGWTITPESSPMGDYYMGSIDGHQVGGMMQAGPDQEGLPAIWTVFFHVQDVDATVERVLAAGGRVLEPPFDLPAARVAIAADPIGAMFGIISGDAAAGPWLTDEPGSVCWVELMSRDPAAAETFYAAVFDWKAETQEADHWFYTTFLRDGDPVAGMMLMPDMVPAEAPSYWGAYFAVADCKATEELAVSLGATVDVPTMPIEPGSFAVLTDPTGAMFQIMQRGA